VFETSLTKEYEICQQTYKFDDQKMLQISEACIDYTFASVGEKEKLRNLFADFKLKMK
jgi:adenosine deaminase